MQRKQSEPSFVQALGHVQSDRRLDILRQIGELGSISKAGRAVGVSYKAAWQAVDTLTNLSGVALVERVVGGRGGGGAQLTEAGRQLLVAAQTLRSARTQAVEQGRIQTDVHAQTAERLAVRTSMRNQWPCVVNDMDVQGQIVLVSLQATASADFRVRARITRESAELLGLGKGIAVQALCKATAVVVVAPGSGKLELENCWSGSITRISRGSLGDEISAKLGGDLQIVGFSAPGAGLKSRMRVVLRVDDSAVVLALS
ncbi:LysR family transcriptional regulator [Diaphorobacter sp. HDW4A]|uniref:LysR family transcriptional regulator n=1 Tax=Diaphorobacter sp. HDW4A TaxID=2714924 RepID=UPI0014083570|nr:LysR family transcriptional regulator [Diaphorobacter sp. HDW4A]QIL81236.1 LysR family transcriptional regulator [Diaphorobacter sp. HDW4A]